MTVHDLRVLIEDSIPVWLLAVVVAVVAAVGLFLMITGRGMGDE